jgi:hypothetical protein
MRLNRVENAWDDFVVTMRSKLKGKPLLGVPKTQEQLIIFKNLKFSVWIYLKNFFLGSIPLTLTN